MYRLPKDYTIRVAKEWMAKVIKLPARYKNDVLHSGSVQHWPPRVQEIFRSWLWKQGINLVRDHKVYYLEFFDEKTASFFVLQYLGE